MRTRTLGTGLVVLAALVGMAACGGGSPAAAPTTTATTDAPTTTLPVMPTNFDWWAPTATPIGHDWTIGPCLAAGAPATKGKALCLQGKGGHQAFLEHFRFSAPGDPDLTHHATQFVSDFLKDRTTGCGQAYRVTAEPVVPLTVPDGPAVRYGFTGGAASAPDSERTVQWAGIRGSVLVIVTISGYDPGSCLPNTGQGSLDDLNGILPGLDALIHASGLPPLAPH